MKYPVVYDLRPTHELVIEVDEPGSGFIAMCGMHDICPECGQKCCMDECDALKTPTEEDEQEERNIYNACVDGLTSFLLAAACEGIDIGTPAMKSAIQTTLEAFANNS